MPVRASPGRDGFAVPSVLRPVEEVSDHIVEPALLSSYHFRASVSLW
jgi:hypothetical protein